MNELTGVFLNAIEKNKNLVIIRQALANAGYSIEEIEQAFSEAQQILSLESQNFLEKPKKKSKTGLWIFLIILILILIAGGISYFLFKEKTLEVLEKIKSSFSS